MGITLNHTIVPAHDKEASAKFFAKIFGLKYEGSMGHFAPVKINATLTLDLDSWDRFEMHHYAFHVGDTEFDAIFGRVKEAGIPYGSGPFSHGDMADQHVAWRARRLFQGSQRPPAGAFDPDLIGERGKKNSPMQESDPMFFDKERNYLKSGVSLESRLLQSSPNPLSRR
jgi:catechol 2,3-dioxygenase-like lactoylglutathione lyase family enzyme